MLSLFEEYVVANATVSVALQDDGVQSDSEELAKLREDERELQTLLIMCYEFAYHVNNFSRKAHRTSTDTAADAIKSIRESQPRFPKRSIPSDDYSAFSKARNDYLDQTSEFFRALSVYLDATK